MCSQEWGREKHYCINEKQRSYSHGFCCGGWRLLRWWLALIAWFLMCVCWSLWLLNCSTFTLPGPKVRTIKQAISQKSPFLFRSFSSRQMKCPCTSSLFFLILTPCSAVCPSGFAFPSCCKKKLLQRPRPAETPMFSRGCFLPRVVHWSAISGHLEPFRRVEFQVLPQVLLNPNLPLV